MYFTDKGNTEHLLVTDGGNDRIRRVVPSTAPHATATVAGGHAEGGLRDGKGAAAAFKQPEGMAARAWPTLVVADTGNHAVRTVGGCASAESS